MSSSSLPGPLRPDPVRVGRLSPLPAVVLREHPDRGQLQRFLAEMQVPLAAMRTMLELVGDSVAGTAAALPLQVCVEHVEHLHSLAADFRDCGTLETGEVRPAPVPVELRPWLDCTLAALAMTAARLQIDLRVQHRSFLPSHVVLDPHLATRAVTAVLRVALQRALPGPLDLRIAFAHDDQVPERSRLRFECRTRGGGFAEIDEGYVFTPFAVRDGADRPWLGLSVGHALCELLGGELRVQSPSPGACSYALALAAPPAAAARWLDPLASGSATFGPVA